MKTKCALTICYKCKYFHNEEPNFSRKDIWYNHYCKASPLEIDINPVTGKMQAITKNDLGTIVYTNRNFAYCRDINKGNCEKYKPNEKEESR